ncbi:MAG: hypothetical protein ACLFVU_06780 [Phycisphaerae bacterium]
MTTITAESVFRKLSTAYEDLLLHQPTGEHPYVGAVVDYESNLDAAHSGATVTLLAGGIRLLDGLDRRLCKLPLRLSPEQLLDRLALAADYLLNVQRPSGRIDLRNCNYDAGPAVGFALQELCPAIETARTMREAGKFPAAVLEKIETFSRRAATGLLDGGFHTPNHRWVVASAMAMAQETFDDFNARSQIDAILAETVDIDDDGAYQERSAGAYDAVAGHSLLILHDRLEWQEALDAVRKNLQMDLHLFHADGTIETGLSSRQDAGTATVPKPLCPVALRLARTTGEQRFADLAEYLWQAPGSFDARSLCRLAELVLVEPAPTAEPRVPDQYETCFAANQLWRVRKGRLSVSAFGDSKRVLSVRFGRAEMLGMSIRQSLIGPVGDFLADRMQEFGGGVRLDSFGLRHPERCGYNLPLGEEVPIDRWEHMNRLRDIRPIPAPQMQLDIRRIADGLELTLKSIGGLDDVASQIAMDFPAGGFWETGDTATITQPGQVMVLKGGAGSMRFGHDVLAIGPGSGAHTTLAMRDTTGPGDNARVLMTFLTPIDHTFRITCRRGV